MSDKKREPCVWISGFAKRFIGNEYHDKRFRVESFDDQTIIVRIFKTPRNTSPITKLKVNCKLISTPGFSHRCNIVCTLIFDQEHTEHANHVKGYENGSVYCDNVVEVTEELYRVCDIVEGCEIIP